MTEDRFVAAPMRARIAASLEAIERERGVRILLAVESGSRAWRFPSVDSDYDVRFLYVHPAMDYLSVEPPREVIERPEEALLDIGGWDLRKALRLALRSNAVLLEWLASPVHYREEATAREAIAALARDACQLPWLAYHYDRQARRSWEEIRATGAAPRLKAYCYALRSALALAWSAAAASRRRWTCRPCCRDSSSTPPCATRRRRWSRASWRRSSAIAARPTQRSTASSRRPWPSRSPGRRRPRPSPR
jgi:hypothetical protein